MLRLCRLRFDSIGAPDVRLAPLLLDFTREGIASDSLVWMRNGGGKTAILSLFFAMLRPDRREFLGGLIEAYGTQTRRRVADHVQASDTAHVVAEWEIAGAQPSLLSDPPERLVTGMVLEWSGKARSSDESRLKRGFYGFRSGRGLEFEGLPISITQPEEKLRPGYTRYRELLIEESKRAPGMELVFTDSQREWSTYLERVGLDPDLARYQLDMNRREGAAHEIFRFRDDADFVEFFLKMVVDPEAADQVAATFSSYAGELAKRPALYQEWTFLDDILAAMRELAQFAQERRAALSGLQTAWNEAAYLRAQLHAGAETRRSQANTRRQEAEVHEARANEMRKKAEEAAGQARAVRLRGAELAHDASRQTLEDAITGETRAIDLHHAWEAAELLVEQRAHEGAIAGFDEQLARRKDEIAPLLENLADLSGRLQRGLAQQQQGLNRKHEDALERLKQAEAVLRQLEKERGDCLELKTRCEERLGTIDKRERAFLGEETVLRRTAVLNSGEELSAGQARYEAFARALEEARIARDERVAKIREERVAADERRVDVVSDKKDREAAREQLRERLSNLRDRIQSLQEEPRLAELAETEQFDLLAMGPGFAKKLREAKASNEAALVRLEIEGFDDRRALAALETDGLLPPSRDVERVLERLATAGIPAAAGWRYLAESVSDGQRRRVLEHSPGLAAGIVVTQVDRLPDARALLEQPDLPLDSALVVGVARGFSGPDDEDTGSSLETGFVLAPRVALFDLDAAGYEREARAASVSSLEERRSKLGDRKRVGAELCRRLESLLEDCPSGHIEKLDAEHDAFDERIAGLDQELKALVKRGVELRAEEEGLREEERRDQGRAAEVVRASEKLAALAKKAREIAKLLESRAGIESDHATAIKGLGEAEANAKAATLQRAAAEADSSDLRVALVPVEERRKEITRDGFGASRDGGEPAISDAGMPPLSESKALDAVADIAVHWSRYEVSRAEYRAASSNDVLRNQRDERLTQLGRVNDKLQSDRFRALNDAAEELLREPAASQDTWRHNQLDLAERKTKEATAERGKADGEESRLNKEVARLRGEIVLAITLPEALQPMTPDEAREISERLDADESKAKDARAAARTAAQDAVNHAERLESHAQNFDAHEKRLASVLKLQSDRLGSDLAVAAGDEGDIEPFAGDLDGVHLEVDARDEALRSSAQRHEKSEKVLRKSVDSLRKVAQAPKYADLASAVRDRIATDDSDHLIETAREHCDSIEVRVAEIIKRIESLDAHRELIVEAIAGVVETSLDLLQGAEKSSKLPAELEAWANRQFLQIRFERPHRDEDLFARLNGLVDRIVDEGSVPRGMPLLLRASLEVVGASGYKVTILKPDAMLRTERFSIAEMGKFSGGQQLTGAILLYCTLAKLRAKNRGRSAAEGGLLILDNPIGTCSNITMLRLQRRVAEAMGIQLVFTTGVNDLDALATMPNIIRLRNDQRDLRSGNLHVATEEDSGPQSGVTATRVFRREATTP